MSTENPTPASLQFESGSYRLPRLWGSSGFWQIKLRWAVAPVMFLGILVGVLLGFEFPVFPVLAIAIASPLYNLVFAWIYKHNLANLEVDPELDRRISLLEVVVDYTAMFLLIHFTGGVSSPLVVFLLFHVIITAVQFSSRTAFQLSAVAGISSGGAVASALRLARESPDATIVAIICDRGDRYLSTGVFAKD